MRKHIGNLSYSDGSVKNRKKIGRGEGSGKGGTSTKGHKGHKSRSGYNQMKGFEGGQMPLVRRIPKFGFTNFTRVVYNEINIEQLVAYCEKGVLNSSEEISLEVLASKGIANKKQPLKILGRGDVSMPLTVVADKFSASASQKIKDAGGVVKVNG